MNSIPACAALAQDDAPSKIFRIVKTTTDCTSFGLPGKPSVLVGSGAFRWLAKGIHSGEVQHG